MKHRLMSYELRGDGTAIVTLQVLDPPAGILKIPIPLPSQPYTKEQIVEALKAGYEKMNVMRERFVCLTQMDNTEVDL